MTLICSLLFAIACTIIWYTSEKARKMKTGVLCLILWGASVMWFIDAVTGFIESGMKYFSLLADDAALDLMIGLSTVALAAVIWLVILLIKDPCGVIKGMLTKK